MRRSGCINFLEERPAAHAQDLFVAVEHGAVVGYFGFGPEPAPRPLFVDHEGRRQVFDEGTMTGVAWGVHPNLERTYPAAGPESP